MTEGKVNHNEYTFFLNFRAFAIYCLVSTGTGGSVFGFDPGSSTCFIRHMKHLALYFVSWKFPPDEAER
jgi:hypothetical protein